MTSLADELVDSTDALVQRWYECWRESAHAHRELSEAALKDKLPFQLRLIGQQLRDCREAEDPARMWKLTDRLDPELRVAQDVPIEEVVQEYRLAVRVVRDWIDEREIPVTFDEYSYFFDAIFQLTAESVRRYTTRQREVVRDERARYLAGVMHQLRTPLAALAMAFDLLERKRTDAKILERLRRSLRRMRTLVDGVLRVERFAPSETEVHPKELAPAELVAASMSDYRPDAARKKLAFEGRVPAALRMTVDPDLFIDALGNLIQNAVKYTESGSVVIESEQDGGDVLFHVRDTGPGVSLEEQRTLFKEAQPGKRGGAGIGLQVAMHAAQAQGGSIALESAPGRGSIFTLRLPRHVEARERSEQKVATKA